MSFKKKVISVVSGKTFSSIFYPVFYILFAVTMAISGSLIFDKNHYIYIYVSGTSMLPTLLGDEARAHYGKADTSKSAIDKLRRFDVIITDYPKGWSDAGLKVKRLWGFPGETISLTCNSTCATFTASKDGNTYSISGIYNPERPFQIETKTFVASTYHFSTGNKIFNTVAINRNIVSKTLGPDEYFVMGDNWGSSTDSYEKTVKEHLTPLTYSYLRGKVINILGTAHFDSSTGVLVDKVNYDNPLYIF